MAQLANACALPLLLHEWDLRLSPHKSFNALKATTCSTHRAASQPAGRRPIEAGIRIIPNSQIGYY